MLDGAAEIPFHLAIERVVPACPRQQRTLRVVNGFVIANVLGCAYGNQKKEGEKDFHYTSLRQLSGVGIHACMQEFVKDG